MNPVLLGTLAATAFSVALIHAALPTHWLPFVLAGRSQRWSLNKTLMVTGLAGVGHVLFTIVLGVVVAALGITLDRWTGSIFPYIAAAVLMLFGGYYCLRDGHGHSHETPGSNIGAGARSDRAVIIGLVAALTFSPCEGFLPVFIAGSNYGWSGFSLLCAILIFATLAGMLLLTWLSIHGLQRLKLESLEHHESRIAGGLLIALGFAVLILET